jgi:hypothetical protein
MAQITNPITAAATYDLDIATTGWHYVEITADAGSGTVTIKSPDGTTYTDHNAVAAGTAAQQKCLLMHAGRNSVVVGGTPTSFKLIVAPVTESRKGDEQVETA